MTESICFLTEDGSLREALQDALAQAPAASRRRFVLEQTSGNRRSQQEFSRLLIVTWASDLPTAQLVARAERVAHRWAGYLVLVGQDTPAEALSASVRLRVQDPARLQFVTASDLDEARSFLRSLVQRLIHAGDSEGLLHAWWSGDTLEIMTTAFRRLGVPRSCMAPLRSASLEECRELEVGHDGSYIEWPSADIQLGFEQIEACLSPTGFLRRHQENADFNRRYGAALRSVRESHGLTQSSIPGLSPRHVGRIERGEARATSKALAKLARALGLTESEYLEQVAARYGAAHSSEPPRPGAGRT